MKLFPIYTLALCMALILVLLPGQAQACCSCPASVRATEKIEWDLEQSGTTGTVPVINNHVTKEFTTHRSWFKNTFFEGYIVPAMEKMTTQLTTTAMQQTVIFGAFLDAKHQLETQRLFQKIQAQAHKEYHPSVGMCEFGSNIKSLASSDRIAELNSLALSETLLDRHLGKSGNDAAGGPDDDLLARIKQYDEEFCDKSDNNGNLEDICPTGASDYTRMNNDINYAKIVENQTKSELNFADDSETDDEKDIIALAKNLYGHRVFSRPPALALKDDEVDPDNTTPIQQAYLDARSLIAKRGVAENSFNALVSMKSEGSGSSTTFLKALLEDLDIPNDEATKILGDKPSYDTQMDILTKKIYQNPDFYTNLYDTPTNVARKYVAMQAIDLMQKFDTYKSKLRSEATLSVLLELAVSDLQNTIENTVSKQAGDSLNAD